MIKQKSIFLLNVLLITSCMSNYSYHKKLYSGQVVNKKFNKKLGFPKDQAFTKDYLILEDVLLHGTKHEVLITNWDMYDSMKDCNIVSDRGEYQKFMLKHYKKGIPLDSACYSKLMFFTIDSEVCRDIDIDPYSYIDEDDLLLDENINDGDSVKCIIRDLLLSENLFITNKHGVSYVRKKHNLHYVKLVFEMV